MLVSYCRIIVQYCFLVYLYLNVKSFLDPFNSVVDKHAPHIKKVSKYKLKLKDEPRLTAGIQKIIQIKNKNFGNKCKDSLKKVEVHQIIL